MKRGFPIEIHGCPFARTSREEKNDEHSSNSHAQTKKEKAFNSPGKYGKEWVIELTSGSSGKRHGMKMPIGMTREENEKHSLSLRLESFKRSIRSSLVRCQETRFTLDAVGCNFIVIHSVEENLGDSAHCAQ